MNVRVRFKQGLDAYPKGSSHFLPDDLATHYIRAGVAELVEHVPAPVELPKPVKQAETTGSKPEDDKQEADKTDEPGKSTKPVKRKRKST